MEIGFVFMRFLLLLLKWIKLPFTRLRCAKGRAVDAASEKEEPLLFYSATKLAEMIRSKELKSEAVVDAYIKRIKFVNPTINAIVEDRFTAAMEEAKNVDEFLSETHLTPKELSQQKAMLGVPVTIKESCSVQGLSLVVGFTFVKGNKSSADGVSVTRLKAAGAIPLLVSTTPELCLASHCDNLVTGRTRNPYDTSRTSGGSTGGEGALIASACSIFGIGSDLAGSVRIPAMFCGIFGHKPTTRLVPTEGHWPTCSDNRFSDYLTIGPLSRYAEDLRLGMKILAESDRKIDFDRKIELNGIKLFFMDDFGFYFGSASVQTEIKSAVRAAVDFLGEAHKMRIQEEKFYDFKTIGESCIFSLVELQNRMEILRDPTTNEKYSLAGQILKHAFGCSPNVTLINALTEVATDKFNAFMPAGHSERHRSKLLQFKEKFTASLGDRGVLILPTFPIPAYRHGEGAWQLTNMTLFNLPMNILGFPSTQIPMGFDRDGLPIGIQVISTHYRDNLCITIAEVLEARFGGWRWSR